VKALLLALVVAFGATTAAAHALRVFARAEGGVVSGYGFFSGGARAAAAEVSATGRDGALIWSGNADAEGGFAFPAPEAGGPVTVALSDGAGHVARITLAREWFAPAPDAQAPDEQALEALVEAAVARQTAPLLEAFARAEARLRFNDVMGGVGMIVGLAGVALWARGRPRP
jgi:nickel transport protein